MKRFFIQCVVSYLIVFLIVPFQAKAQDPATGVEATRVAIVPLTTDNQTTNTINNEVADALRNNLKNSFQVMSVDNADQIIKKQNIEPDKGFVYDPQIIALIQEATDAYGLRQDVNGAVTLFDEAIAAILKSPQMNRALSALYVSTVFNKAFVLHRAGRTAEAAKIISEVTTINARVASGLDGFSQPFKDFVAEQTKSSEGNETGNLSFTGTPRSFDVLVNGIFIGTAPLTYSLPVGKYSVTLCADGRKSVIKPAVVSTSSMQTIDASLPWLAQGTEKSLASDSYGGYTDAQKIALLSQISSSTGADKVVLLDFEQIGSAIFPKTLVYDTQHHQVLKPITYKKIQEGQLRDSSPDMISHFSKKIRPYISKDAARLYEEDYSGGNVDTALAMRNKKPITKKTGFWIGVGTVILGGIITGLVLSRDKSSGGDGQGSLTISFDPFK